METFAWVLLEVSFGVDFRLRDASQEDALGSDLCDKSPMELEWPCMF